MPIHPPGTLSSLPPEAHIGPVDPETLPRDKQEQTEEEKRIASARANLPPPEAALNLHDITVCPASRHYVLEVNSVYVKPLANVRCIIFHQKFAEQVLTGTAWAYYRSAGDDNYSAQFKFGQLLSGLF